MRKCCVKGCTGGNPETVSLHGLFVKGKFIDDWLDAIQLLNKQIIDKACSRGAKICSEHFDKKYVLDYGGHNRIMPGAVPTIFPEVAKKQIGNFEFFAFSHASKGHNNSNSLNTVETVEPPSCSSYSVLTESTPKETSGVKRPYQRYPGDTDTKQTTPKSIRRLSEHVTKMLKAKESAIKNMQRKIKRRDKKIKNLRSFIHHGSRSCKTELLKMQRNSSRLDNINNGA